jgi:hypothetical protein
MFPIRACPLPDGARLSIYRASDACTNCVAADVAGTISQEQFVSAFYTTFVFKLERAILKWAMSKLSSDAQVQQLAAGSIDEFAAWHVEGRCPNP